MKKTQAVVILAVIVLLALGSCEENGPCYFKSPVDYATIFKGDTVYINIGAEDVIVDRFEIQLYINDKLCFDTDYGSLHYLWPTRYEKPGTKKLVAIATNARGRSFVLERVIVIHDPKIPAIDFTASAQTVMMFDTVSFTDFSTNYPFQWRWIFGDGGGSDLQHPGYAYTKSGTYDVQLTAWNKYGLSFDTKSACITVEPKMLFVDPRDDKSYISVEIGDQWWMGENLAYLPDVSQRTEGSPEDPHYYVYGSDGSSVEQAKATGYYSNYGVLYNFPAALESCPVGWHLPSLSDWEQLAMFISENNEAYIRDSIIDGERTYIEWWNVGNHLRAESYSLGLDDVGFGALPGGYLTPGEVFGDIGEEGYWWGYRDSVMNYELGVNEFDPLIFGVELSSNMTIQIAESTEEPHLWPEFANSVRCVKDTIDVEEVPEFPYR